MSVTVEFSDVDSGDNLKIVVQYDYGDYNLLRTDIDCPIFAEKHARGFIRILEEDREKFSDQEVIKFKKQIKQSQSYVKSA